MAKRFLLGVLVVSLLCNLYAVWLYFDNREKVAEINAFDDATAQYPFLATRILQKFPQDVLINFTPLRSDLHNLVDPWGDSFGFYFEYLPTGTSVTDNANNQFYAASLFKLPVVMAYYYGKEDRHDTSDPTLTVKKEDIDSQFGSLWKEGPGTKLKASEAVRLTLEESDNTAVKTLLPLIHVQDFNSVYNGLDLDLKTGEDGALVTARSVSTILKALYFSAILNKDDSQMILSMLTKTPFDDKMVAGIPNNVPVAHKIGDFIDQDHDVDGTKNNGYRDCGIVYVPRRPYLLCMFSTSDEQTANQRMALVSKKIYNYVNKIDQ